MAKLYYPTPDELLGARPLDEQVWFGRYQHLLVRLANTDWGRDLLRIDKYPYPVAAIGKNYVHFHLGMWDEQDHYLSDFRIGAKWGNIIRSRWLDVRGALDYMWLEEAMEWPLVGAGRSLATACFTTTTFYPDPNVETSSVDGYVSRDGIDETFSTIRDADNATSAFPDATIGRVLIRSSTTTNQYQQLRRYFCLFDTQAIGSTSTINSATFQAAATVKDDDLGGSGAISFIDTNPASNTDIVVGDYTTGVEMGTAQQAADVTIANITADSSTYNTWTLNATGEGNISKAGVSKFGLRVARDRTDSEPTWASNQRSRIVVVTADQSGTSADPKLVVLWTAAVAFTPRAIMF